MKKIISIFTVIAMTALSCTKQENEGIIYLKINSTTVGQTGENPAKAVITETSFPREQEVSFGLFVVGDSYNDEKYCNIKCTKPAGSDKFSYPSIELIKGKTATVYAYYPYDENIEKVPDAVKAIPVLSSVGGHDWMWSTPVEDVSTEKSAIDLKFNHALALVEITFDILAPSDGMMTKLQIATGGATFGSKGFHKKGALNAQDGKFTADSSVTTSHPLLLDVSLPQSDNQIIAECLLVPSQYDYQYSELCNFYIACEFNGKYYHANTGLTNGVRIVQGYKSTIHLKITDNEMTVGSIDVKPWNDGISVNAAVVNGHKVTFNTEAVPDLSSTITVDNCTPVYGDLSSGVTTVSSATLEYDPATVPEGEYLHYTCDGNCKCVFDRGNSAIIVSDVMEDVTVNLTFAECTAISYSAKDKVEPTEWGAMGVPYDNIRSTFDYFHESGVMYFDGEVTKIEKNAFRNCEKLIAISLPESVEYIYDDAFSGCINLLYLNFNSLTHLGSIGVSAFKDCGLTAAKMPESLTWIGESAFSGCVSLVGFDMSECNDLRSIGKDCFNGCTELGIVEMPEGSLSVIPDGAFRNCSRLYTIKNLNQMTTLTSIGVSSFENCRELGEVSFPKSLIRIQEKAFSGCTGLRRVDLTACSQLKYFQDYCFYSCSSLVSVWFPSYRFCSVVSIGDSSFENCSSLSDIKLPQTIKTIGNNAFRRCTSLKSVSLPSVTDLGCAAFDNCSALESVYVGGFLKTIPEYCFNACTHLCRLSLGRGLEKIEKNAFWHMGHDATESKWEPLQLPSTLKEIGQFAFEDSRIQWLQLNSPLETVGTDAFKSCSLETLFIRNVSNIIIGRKMFNNCSSLKDIYCDCATPPNIVYRDNKDTSHHAFAYEGNFDFDKNVLSNVQEIYVPNGCRDQYILDEGWKAFEDKKPGIIKNRE